MASTLKRFSTLVLLVIGILAVFLGYPQLAETWPRVSLFDIFDTVTILGSIAVVAGGFRLLRKSDWYLSVLLGVGMGIGASFATLYSPFPYLGLVRTLHGMALIHGLFTCLACLGGLVVMRSGGPVLFRGANREYHRFARSLGFGLLIGLPLAVINVFALQLTQGHGISWQSPLSAILDALQPAILEEMLYRFAFLGLMWMLLRRQLPEQAAWISGLLALLVHNYAHLSDLIISAPLTALGMGAVMALLWGFPETILALRRDLESAAAFHWMQDAVRFLVGF